MCFNHLQIIMFIAHHINPFNGIVRYNTNNDENIENPLHPTWNLSNSISYKVDVTQFIKREATHYAVWLTVFSCIAMKEEEIVKLACNNIIRDTDKKYIELAVYSSSNESPHHHFDKRLYKCCASREVNNHTVRVCEHLPAVSVEVFPRREGSPRDQE